ncbi:MAG TPA: hypothetical protein VN456_09300 [Desulfosporosinus sp.]|nr:hypothetical protein [Desulfosporosinus sp.]
MLNCLFEGVILGVSLLVICVIIERIRIATGKEMLIDKLIAHLEDVYQLTSPKANKEMELRGFDLPDKVQLIKVFFHDPKSK